MMQRLAEPVDGSDPMDSVELGWWGWLVRLLHRRLTGAWRNLRNLVAFGLITLGVMVRPPCPARGVVRLERQRQLARLALNLLPMVGVMSLVLGFVVIGQSVSLLNRVGARDWLGTVMVVAVIREIGPLLTALLLLARSGTANVVELGTVRATGEVESLEAAGIDPIHFLVVPRVTALAAGSLALSIYLILGAVLSGFLWAFVQDVPLLPGQYVSQIVGALHWLDVPMLVGKTLCFGAIIGIVTSYQGLAQLLRPEDIAGATARAVGQCILLCVVTELGFILFYLAL